MNRLPQARAAVPLLSQCLYRCLNPPGGTPVGFMCPTSTNDTRTQRKHNYDPDPFSFRYRRVTNQETLVSHSLLFSYAGSFIPNGGDGLKHTLNGEYDGIVNSGMSTLGLLTLGHMHLANRPFSQKCHRRTNTDHSSGPSL
ncbi:unnamed protein product [Boreogadus saida]